MQKPWLAYTIDRSSHTPVFEQICASLRSDIIDGRLGDGSRLPPTRIFAAELGVSRSTIVTAYDQLVAEGYIAARQGSGFTVCPLGDVELASDAAGPAATSMAGGDVSEPAPVRPFRPGHPDMRLFPYAQWSKTVARICRTDPQSMLTGGTVHGHFALRSAIAGHIAEWRGITASPHQVIVTAGSGDALEICLRTLSGAGDIVGLEDPGYGTLRHFAEAQGVEVSHLMVDELGTCLPDQETDARLVVLTPSHQFPLGGAMAPSRRLEFVQWAAERGSWIIEDDYDSEFRYAGRPIPALAGFDRLQRTIYVGSFSKIFSNSLRLGYLVVPDELRPLFDATLQRFGIKASLMPQMALAQFIDRGEFYRHLRRVRRIYGERRKVLIDLLADHFPDCGQHNDHQAGMQIAWHLPDTIPDHAVERAAKGRGLSAQALSSFCAEDRALNGLLLGFCGFTEQELRAGMADLKQCVDQVIEGL